MKKYIRPLIRQWIQTTTLNQYEYDLTSLLDINPTYQHFTFRKLNENDFRSNNVFNEKDRIHRYLNHMEKGHECYGFTTSTGTVAAYFWLTIGKPQSPTPNPAFKYFDWLITNKEAYIWDCRTVPNFQQQGLYREGLKRLVQLCQQKNIEKVMISCEPENQISDIGIQSAGFRCKGTAFAIKTKLFKCIRCTQRKLKFSSPSAPATTGDVFPWK